DAGRGSRVCQRGGRADPALASNRGHDRRRSEPAMSELRHYVERRGDVDWHVIELPPIFTEDAQLAEFERLEKKILGHGTQIEVDCRQVKHMNSTAWGVIITAYTRAQRQGGTLKIEASGNAHILHFLHVTGLERLNDADGGAEPREGA